jgi:hypothetical protein
MPVVTTKAPKPVDPNAAQAQAPGGPAPVPQAPSLPYAQPNQLLNVVKPAQPKPTTVTNTIQGNTAVMQTAQQEALNAQNKPNETMGLVQQGVQGILKNPLGYDKDKYVQNQLEQFDRNRSNAMSAFQQSNADTSNTGLNLEKAYNYAMEGAQGRSDLENAQRMEQATKEREAMLSALGMGNQTVQNQSALDEAAFNRLSTARNMAEGERSQAQGQENAKELQTLGHTQNLETLGVQQGYDMQKLEKTFGNEMARMVSQSNLDTQSKTTLMELQEKIDTKQLLTTQDFSAAQKDLDRQLEIAKQNNDATNTANLTKLKADLDLKAQEAQNTFTKELTKTNQLWQTSERIGSEDATRAIKAIDIAAEQARQDKDIDTQKYLEDQKANLQLKLQTQEMGQQEKMAYIEAQIADAKANGDTDRQKTLISFQTTQDLTKAYEEGKIDEGKIALQGKIDQALKSSDHEAAEALQTSGYIFEASENAKDRALKQAGVNLDAIAAAEEAGQIAAGSLQKYMNTAMANLGISVSAPDEMATQKELVQQFQETKMQWGLSHPESLVDRTDPTKGLTPDGANSFNEFYNTTLYNDQDFGSSAYKPIVWSDTSATTNASAFASTPPAVGSFIRYNGQTYKVSSEVTADQTAAGGGKQQFTAIDTKTGNTVTIKVNPTLESKKNSKDLNAIIYNK